MNIITYPETQKLDEIDINSWFTTKYGPLELKECESLIENHVWITARKVKIFVKSMTTNHIINCIKCWNGQGNMKIPIHYLGGKDKWLKIFNQELLNRQ